MKRIVYIIISIILLLSLIVGGCYAYKHFQETKDQKIIQETVTEWIVPTQYNHYDTIPEVEAEMDRLSIYYQELEDKLNKTYGHDDEKYMQASRILIPEFDKILNLTTRYEDQIGKIYLEEINAFWEERQEKYPEATLIWLYMKEHFKWSDEVCAGIIGNIMAEIGGGTLDFSDWDNNDGSYGIFQWIGLRKKEIKSKYGDIPTIEEQLEFMYDELYGTDGVTKQVTDSQREKILNSASPEEAAIRFCKWFERPESSGNTRKQYALFAYEIFTSNEKEQEESNGTENVTATEAEKNNTPKKPKHDKTTNTTKPTIEVTAPSEETEPTLEKETVPDSDANILPSTPNNDVIEKEEEQNDKIYLGNFRLTAYCGCRSCNGKWAGQTSTGLKPKQGRTIAVDPKVIPYGSKVIINGHTYIAEDCGGGIKNKRIDIYFDSHSECNQFGVQYADVYLVK